MLDISRYVRNGPEGIFMSLLLEFSYGGVRLVALHTALSGCHHV